MNSALLVSLFVVLAATQPIPPTPVKGGTSGQWYPSYGFPHITTWEGEGFKIGGVLKGLDSRDYMVQGMPPYINATLGEDHFTEAEFTRGLQAGASGNTIDLNSLAEGAWAFTVTDFQHGITGSMASIELFGVVAKPASWGAPVDGKAALVVGVEVTTAIDHGDIIKVYYELWTNRHETKTLNVVREWRSSQMNDDNWVPFLDGHQTVGVGAVDQWIGLNPSWSNAIFWNATLMGTLAAFQDRIFFRFRVVGGSGTGSIAFAIGEFNMTVNEALPTMSPTQSPLPGNQTHAPTTGGSPTGNGSPTPPSPPTTGSGNQLVPGCGGKTYNAVDLLCQRRCGNDQVVTECTDCGETSSCKALSEDDDNLVLYLVGGIGGGCCLIICCVAAGVGIFCMLKSNSTAPPASTFTSSYQRRPSRGGEMRERSGSRTVDLTRRESRSGFHRTSSRARF